MTMRSLWQKTSANWQAVREGLIEIEHRHEKAFTRHQACTGDCTSRQGVEACHRAKRALRAWRIWGSTLCQPCAVHPGARDYQASANHRRPRQKPWRLTRQGDVVYGFLIALSMRWWWWWRKSFTLVPTLKMECMIMVSENNFWKIFHRCGWSLFAKKMNHSESRVKNIQLPSCWKLRWRSQSPLYHLQPLLGTPWEPVVINFRPSRKMEKRN